MPQALPSYFVDDIAQTALEARVPSYVAGTGMTAGGGNAPGIGISTENPNLEESLPNWTLLDQHGNVRQGQLSQCLGGPGISDPSTSTGQAGTLPDAVARYGANPANVAGQPDNDAPVVAGQNCWLSVLADGWIQSP